MTKKIILFLSLWLFLPEDNLQAQNVGIGTNIPSEKLHVVGNARITVLGGVGTRMVVADANGVLGTQAIPTAAGDITGVTAGSGLTGGGTTGTVTVTAAANNGLYVNAGADRIRLGGALVENTTITNGIYNMFLNLDGTGSFHIQDVGVNHFSVMHNGDAAFGSDVYWRDGSTAGTILAQMIDDGDDGRFLIRENGTISIDLDANTQAIFNEQGLDRNFRVESDGNANMLFVDGGTNRVGIATGTPTRTLDVNGTVRIRGGGAVAGAVLVCQDNTGNATWSNAGFGMVPVGSIVAWHGNIGGSLPALPTGWVECLGGTVNDVASPINGRPIPDLNNNTTSVSGDASQGHFLRGGTTSGLLESDDANNFEQVEANDTDQGTINGIRTIDDDGNWSSWMATSRDGGDRDPLRFRVAGIENRVTNMSVRWIMRIK